MMGKRAAQALAREERLCWGDLLTMILRTPPDTPGISVINSTMPRAKIRELFVEGVTMHELTEVPKMWHGYNQRGAKKPTAYFLFVTNILREFGPPLPSPRTKGHTQ